MAQVINEELLSITREIIGKEDTEEAMRIALLNFVDSRITECKDKIKSFQKKKYGMTLEKFYKNLDLSWEQENDYMEWDFTVGELEMLKDRKEKLIGYGRKTVC